MSGKSFGPPPLGGNSVPEADLHPVVSSVCNTLELEPDVRFRRVAKLAHAEAIRRWRILQHMRLCRRRSNNLARSLRIKERPDAAVPWSPHQSSPDHVSPSSHPSA